MIILTAIPSLLRKYWKQGKKMSLITLKIEEDGKPLKTIEIDEGDWKPSDTNTYEIAFVSTWITVEDRWGYQLSLHLQRPPKDVRDKYEA